MSEGEKTEDEQRIERQEQIAKEWENKEVKIPMGNFLIILLYQGFGPLLVPVYLCCVYGWLWTIYLTYWYIFVILLPILFMGIYALYIAILTEMSYWLVKYWCDKKSPPEEGEYARDFSGGDVEDVRLRYYHVRGFIFKWPVFFSKKSIFPWSQTYVLNRLGENKIHRDAMYWDAFVGLEMIELGERTVIQDGVVLSSHVVDSIFGSLTIKWVKFGNDCICTPNCSAAPGATIHDNMVILPNTFVTKSKNLPDEVRYCAGTPSKPFEFEGLETIWNKHINEKRND